MLQVHSRVLQAIDLWPSLPNPTAIFPGALMSSAGLGELLAESASSTLAERMDGCFLPYGGPKAIHNQQISYNRQVHNWLSSPASLSFVFGSLEEKLAKKHRREHSCRLCAHRGCGS